jgi:hypothetical protein
VQAEFNYQDEIQTPTVFELDPASLFVTDQSESESVRRSLQPDSTFEERTGPIKPLARLEHATIAGSVTTATAGAAAALISGAFMIRAIRCPTLARLLAVIGEPEVSQRCFPGVRVCGSESVRPSLDFATWGTMAHSC